MIGARDTERGGNGRLAGAKTAGRRRLRPRAIFRLFGRFAPLLRPYRRTLAGAGLCMVGATAMEVMRPWPIKVIFDGVLAPQAEAGAIVRRISEAVGADYLVPAAAFAMLAIAAVGGLFSFGQAYLISTVGQKLVAGIRQRLYSHLQRLSHSFHDEHSFGDLVARMNGDVNLMRDLMVNAVIFASARLLLLVGMLAVMFLMDWRLTLVAIAILPPLFMAVGRFGAEIKGAARRQRRKESQISEVMTERMAAIKLVQAFARESYEEERFAVRNSNSAQAGLRATRLEAHLDRLVQVILAVGTAAVIWYGVVRVQAGALTPGDLLVFAAYLTGLYKPVRKLSALTGRVAKATASGERIAAILDLEPEIRDAPNAIVAPFFAGRIRFEAVEFAYRSRRPVLRGVDFEIRPGEVVALVGESGSGKSTIANLILRFYDPTAGRITIDGTDIRRFTLESLRSRIAIVLQDAALFHTSIRENIAYGKLDATDEEIVAAAKAAGAHDFITALPDGYDTEVGERGAALSGGQRQRIAIARAIVRDAAIVVLDEPLRGLDDASAAKVEAALTRLVAGRTCIWITHDLARARRADRVLSIADGRVTVVRPSRPETARPLSAALTAGSPA